MVLSLQEPAAATPAGERDETAELSPGRSFPAIRSVFVRNYKSLGDVAVRLGNLTVLVGPNGAGKSNFVDALAFVQEALADSIDLAFKNRGGIGAVRRRSGGHPWHIGLALTLDLEGGTRARYAFQIAAKPKERFRVSREQCAVQPAFADEASFEIRDGTFVKPIAGIRPRVEADRFALYAASATEEFRPVYDFLTSMRFYSIAPESLRDLQDPDPGEFLKRDGGNAAAVLKRLRDQPESYDRVCRLLAQAVEGVESVEPHSVGTKETLQFRQDIGLAHPWTFEPVNMSDGTLRLLGLLLAVYQPSHAALIGIEEPESTVHPAVSELVLEVLRDAARRRQIVVTTHSPDILDSKDLLDDQILAVTKERGSSVIAGLALASRKAIRERLYTAGELLRVNELTPDVAAARHEAQQAHLFPNRFEPRS
jgi:predicted ATPase